MALNSLFCADVPLSNYSLTAACAGNRMGRKKISITPITDDRNKQVPIMYLYEYCDIG